MEPNNPNQVPQTPPSPATPPGQNLNQGTQPVPESSSPKKKLPVLKLLVASLVLLISVFAIVIIGYLVLGQNNSSENQLSEPNANETNTTSGSNSDWLTFNSSIEDFPITFDYPSDWSMKNVVTVVSLHPPQGGKDELDEELKKLQSTSIEITKSDINPEECDELCPNFESKEDKVINGKKFRVLKGTDSNVDGFEYEFIHSVVKVGDWYYRITLFPDNVEGDNPGIIQEDMLNIYDQLLSTVKFKENNILSVDSFNWKEYNNQDYGISVNYPDGWIINEDHKKSGNDENSFIVFSIGELPSGGIGVTFHKNYKEIETYGFCFREELTTASATINNKVVEKVYCDGLPTAIRYNDDSDVYTLRGYAVDEGNSAVIDRILSSVQFTN